MILDVNIFEDVIRRRERWEGSLSVLSEVRSKSIKGFISALTIPILYFLRKIPDSEARTKVKQIIQGFEIVDLTSEIIADAMDDEKFADFEDAIQFYSAKSVNVKTIITRNKKHFKVVENRIEIQTPEEFLRGGKQ